MINEKENDNPVIRNAVRSDGVHCSDFRLPSRRAGQTADTNGRAARKTVYRRYK